MDEATKSGKSSRWGVFIGVAAVTVVVDQCTQWLVA